MNPELKRAAREFINPTKTNYQRQNETEYINQFGKAVWQDACIKARTEYNFGSNAVRW